MSGSLLILRPEPGASRTAERAEAIGRSAVKAPLFAVHPLDWTVPAGPFEAVFLTSANAARTAGAALAAFTGLPCYAVGETTEAAAREAGFHTVRTGSSDAVALLDLAARDGIEKALHLCGREHLPLEHAQIAVTSVPVYAAEAVTALPRAAAVAIAGGALALLHSPRAARTFGELVDAAGLDRGAIAIAAISTKALVAAGGGWRAAEAAAEPRDPALLALARKLCQTEGGTGSGASRHE